MIRRCISMRIAVIALVVCPWLVGIGEIGILPAAAQVDEATRLSQQLSKLYNDSRYSEAIPIARRLLELLQKDLGPEHPDVAQSLNNLAMLYVEQRGYSDAEPLYKRSLAIYEAKLGKDHPDVASTLNNLANVYELQGKYADAEAFYQRSLAIREKVHGPDHPAVAVSLNNLALLYDNQGRYSDAEPLYKRSLAIREKVLGPDHPDVGTAFNNLAQLYLTQGRYGDAELLIKRSLAIQEKALGTEHPEVARALNDLAEIYRTQGRYADAEPLFMRGLAIFEKALGPNHLDVAQSLNDLAGLYNIQARYADAELLHKRSLEIREKALRPDHPVVAASLNNLANVYLYQGRYADAEPRYKRSLAIFEKALGPEHLYVAQPLRALASVYVSQGRYSDAEPLLKRSLEISEKLLGPDHPNVAPSLNALAGLYEIQARHTDAELLVKRSLAMMEKAHGAAHSDVAITMSKLAEIYRTQGRYADAEPLFMRSLERLEKALSPNHPEVATSLNNLAALYEKQGRYADAESLLKRALEVRKKTFGPDHPDVADSLNNLAVLYGYQRRYADAEPLYMRGLAILEKDLGPDHPRVALMLNNIALAYIIQGRHADAEPLQNRALTIREKAFGPDHPEVAKSLYTLALLHHFQGRTDAEPLLKRALAIRERGLGPDHPDVGESLAALSMLYFDQGRYADALPIVRRSAKSHLLNAKSGFISKEMHLSVLLAAKSHSIVTNSEAINESYLGVQQATSSSASDAINQLSIRFAAGNDQLAQIIRRDQDLAIENKTLNKLIIEAVSKEPAKRDATTEKWIKTQIQGIASERIQLQEILTKEFPKFAELAQPIPLSIRGTQRLLADDEALVIFDFSSKSYAWIVTRADEEWTALKITAQELETQIMTLRESLTGDGPFDVQLAYRIYQEIFGAFSDKVALKKRISIVTNGALTSLPIQLLVTKDPTGRLLKEINWLVRTHAITNLPSVASLGTLRGASIPSFAIKPMIAFADPVFSKAVSQQVNAQANTKVPTRSLARFATGTQIDTRALGEHLQKKPIFSTRKEVQAIAKILVAHASDLHFGFDATETAVKTANLDQYRIVYFATHGLVAGDLEEIAKAKIEPSLAFSFPDNPTDIDDGLLTASEVAQLKLNADWVVLSACNTAAEDKPGAEALSGLARAFFYAGARSLLVSHWEVDDEATAALMTGVFLQMKNNPKLSHGEALRQSMLAILDNAKTDYDAHPRMWAPFVVVGEPAKPN